MLGTWLFHVAKQSENEVLVNAEARNELIGDLLAGRRRSWCAFIGASVRSGEYTQ